MNVISGNKKGLGNDDLKDQIIERIIHSFETFQKFLILGHKLPDEDCLAAMVSVALLIAKFNRSAVVYIPGEVHPHFNYLLSICRYNSITILRYDDNSVSDYDAIIVCDTPKPEMIDCTDQMKELIGSGKILVIEIDHHTGTDSAYVAGPDYSLVDEASSACELIGEIALAVADRSDIREANGVGNVFTRNLVLALLTGIVGDSQMGRYFKSDKERESYDLFSAMYNEILRKETTRRSNLSTIEEIFSEIRKLSSEEEDCHNYLAERRSEHPFVQSIVLGPDDSITIFQRFAYDTVISLSRSMADLLSEASGKFGLVVFYDRPDRSDLIQFRIRRSQHYKDFDLRKVLSMFSITDGGGHEGAIAFRISKNSIKNIGDYVDALINRLAIEIQN